MTHRSQHAATRPIPAVTDQTLSEWEAIWREENPDTWMAPLRHGGARVEREMRRTYRERGLMLAKRVGRKAERLRRALTTMRGGRA